LLIADLPFQLIIACSKGGTSIEDLAEKYPDMIIKVKFPNLIVGSICLFVSYLHVASQNYVPNMLIFLFVEIQSIGISGSY
jgi:hypothetical protein